jgi:uncharacterized protein YqeY
MTVKDRIIGDLKKAMLAKEELERDTLRMLKADVMNREVELGRDVTDDEAVALLQKAVKSRKDAIEQYEAGGRADAADREREEIAIVERYLPKQLDESETRAAIEALVGELGLSGKKDLGRVMKELKSRHGAAIDGKTASKIAGEVLG